MVGEERPIIREIRQIEELRQAEALQRIVWGEGDAPDPADLLHALIHAGGLVAGAFLDDELVGVAYNFPTSDPRIQHSHRLAVHKRARGCGVATRLKLFQRDWAVAKGIKQIRWTFDPLRFVNASLNISRLGGTCQKYLPDFYGQMSGLNSGIASDRLLLEWDTTGHQWKVEDLEPRTSIRIKIPRDVDELLENDIAEAKKVRLATRKRFLSAFGQGYTVVGFDRKHAEYVLYQGADAAMGKAMML